MCSIDWTLFADMLRGTGTLLLGVAAMLTLLFQFWYKRKASEYENALKLMLLAYRTYMGGEEGIVWKDYPSDAEQIVAGIVRRTHMDRSLVQRLLDKLKTEGKI